MKANNLNEYQRKDLIKYRYILLNGRYSQTLITKGTKKHCLKSFDPLRENKYNRFLLWKHKTTFYLTFGNN